METIKVHCKKDFRGNIDIRDYIVNGAINEGNSEASAEPGLHLIFGSRMVYGLLGKSLSTAISFPYFDGNYFHCIVTKNINHLNCD